MEKLNPTYDLKSVKEAVKNGRVRITFTARRTVYELGGNENDVMGAFLSLERRNFYKSMTSYADHRTWQDVYHVPWRDITIYLKFMIDEEGYLVLSFKEK